jgi:hypothetical protein
MFHLPDLSGERHLNFLLGAVVEILSYVLAYFILTRFGRRLPMASFLFISGIICVVVGAVSVLPEDAYWIGKEIFLIAITRAFYYNFHRLFEKPLTLKFCVAIFSVVKCSHRNCMYGLNNSINLAYEVEYSKSPVDSVCHGMAWHLKPMRFYYISQPSG